MRVRHVSDRPSCPSASDVGRSDLAFGISASAARPVSRLDTLDTLLGGKLSACDSVVYIRYTAYRLSLYSTRPGHAPLFHRTPHLSSRLSIWRGDEAEQFQSHAAGKHLYKLDRRRISFARVARKVCLPEEIKGVNDPYMSTFRPSGFARCDLNFC